MLALTGLVQAAGPAPLEVQTLTVPGGLVFQIGTPAGDSVPVVWAKGHVAIVRIPGVATARRWVEVEHPGVARALVHPGKAGTREAYLRVRLSRSLTAPEAAQVRAQRLGSVVELRVPDGPAAARRWAAAGGVSPVRVEIPTPRLRASRVVEPPANTTPPAAARLASRPPTPLTPASVSPPNAGRGGSVGASPGARAARWVLAALGLVGLLAGAIAVRRRRRRSPEAAFEVLGRLDVGPGQRVTLVAVDGARLLLGTDGGGSRVLARWPDAAGSPDTQAAGGALPDGVLQTLDELGGL